MLQQWSQETHSQFWDNKPKRRTSEDSGNSYGRLPYQLWNVSKYGTCTDAAITGIVPPPLMELQVIITLLDLVNLLACVFISFADGLRFLCFPKYASK